MPSPYLCTTGHCHRLFMFFCFLLLLFSFFIYLFWGWQEWIWLAYHVIDTYVIAIRGTIGNNEFLILAWLSVLCFWWGPLSRCNCTRRGIFFGIFFFGGIFFFFGWLWLLAFGFWLLAFGFWHLAPSFWLLAFGF